MAVLSLPALGFFTSETMEHSEKRWVHRPDAESTAKKP
jgi:hypothetical protein